MIYFSFLQPTAWIGPCLQGWMTSQASQGHIHALLCKEVFFTELQAELGMFAYDFQL